MIGWMFANFVSRTGASSKKIKTESSTVKKLKAEVKEIKDTDEEAFKEIKDYIEAKLKKNPRKH